MRLISFFSLRVPAILYTHTVSCGMRIIHRLNLSCVISPGWNGNGGSSGKLLRTRNVRSVRSLRDKCIGIEYDELSDYKNGTSVRHSLSPPPHPSSFIVSDLLDEFHRTNFVTNARVSKLAKASENSNAAAAHRD